MSAAWVLYVLAIGVLLTMAAASLDWGARALGLPTRWAWTAALAGIVALAVIAPRHEPVTVFATTAVRTERPIGGQPSADVGFVERLRGVSAVVSETAASMVSRLDRHLPSSVARAMLATWLAASGLLLALFAIAHLRLARVRRGWDVHRAYDVEIRIAPATGPAVLGFLRAEIVVPRSLLDRSADEQRVILQHEREHLAARDHLLLTGAWFVVIALPWHPAVWFLLERLRLAIELDCDARLLRGGVPARRYGALLIDIAAQTGRTRIGALALADGPSHLERRILAMGAPRRRYAKTWGAAVITLGAALTFVACEAKVPTAADISAMDVASAQRSASEAGFMRTPSNDRTDFFINGVRVSADQARALEARKIGSIEVVKSELPSGRDTIFVTTADKMLRKTVQGDPREPVEMDGTAYSFERKQSSDSSEHMVAHVERELAGYRTRRDASLPSTSTGQKQRTPRPGGDKQPTITIDGKVASEAQLAALDERDIASIAVYKGKQGQLLVRSDGKEHLEATSGPPTKIDAKGSEALIAVTTKMARRAQSKSQ
jgi:beta-lactamase regulating signal transducer with metallopeptidase domain